MNFVNYIMFVRFHNVCEICSDILLLKREAKNRFNSVLSYMMSLLYTSVKY